MAGLGGGGGLRENLRENAMIFDRDDVVFLCETPLSRTKVRKMEKRERIGGKEGKDQAYEKKELRECGKKERKWDDFQKEKKVSKERMKERIRGLLKIKRIKGR